MAEINLRMSLAWWFKPFAWSVCLTVMPFNEPLAVKIITFAVRKGGVTFKTVNG